MNTDKLVKDKLKGINTKEQILKFFIDCSHPFCELVSEAEKRLGLKRGTYIKHKSGIVYKSAYVHYDEEKGLTLMVEYPHIELSINKIEIISKEEFYNEKNIKHREKILEEDYWKKHYKIRDLEDELSLYKYAHGVLIKGDKLTPYKCTYGPCLKGNLGCCDGECDHPGA